MSGGAGQLVLSGPLLLALPVAAAAGAVTFLSPCVLPLVPGYLSYLTGMSGSAAADSDPDAAPGQGPAAAAPVAAAASAVAVLTGSRAAEQAGSDLEARRETAGAPPGPPGRPTAGGAARPGRFRVLLGTALFITGFSALFAAEGTAFGSLGSLLITHERGLAQLLGALVIVLGLLFAGAFDRFSMAGWMIRPSARPRAGLAGAPLLGVLFGLGWTPCIGPTLAAVLTLGLSSGTAARGAVLAFAYGLGLGVPFLAVALAFDRSMRLVRFARRHARLITRIGGLMLITVGLLEVTGAWTAALTWLRSHWVAGYNSPL